MVRVAINGFGRIGRLVFKAGFNHEDVDFVAINDLTDDKTLHYLLKRDSVHGAFPGDVGYDNDHLIVNGKAIKVFSEKDPEKLPWKDLNIDIVLECTGRFLTRELAEKHIKAGAKKVLLSAPAKSEVDLTVVRGVNCIEINDSKKIVSNASCTTNCLAPVASVLHKNLNIIRGFMTTVHSYTNDQNILDLPHKDPRRARAAAVSTIPSTTGAAKSVGIVIPDLNGKLDGMAMRVPIPDGSLVDFTCEVEKETSIEAINNMIREAANTNMKGIIEYSEEPLVSIDIVDNPNSAIFDSGMTRVMHGKFVKVLIWYDNEWGYSNRLLEVMKFMATR